MNKRKVPTRRKTGKFLSLLLVITLVFFSFQVNITPAVAGRSGASSVASASAGATRWGLETVKAKGAWKITQGSDEVVVAVIDSGIDKSIPAFEGRIWKNEDEVPGDGIDNDGNGYVDDVSGWDFRKRTQLSKYSGSLHYHGTFVGGLISSSYDSKTGSGGVAPHVSIMDLRFLDSGGRFYTSDWEKMTDAIDYAVQNGADIINLSIYASVSPPEMVHRALKRAQDNGVLVVGIAGNRGRRVGYFGRWKEVFTVGAVNKAGNVSSFSNYGPEVELVAPGADVLSYKPGGNLATGSGTSFAAPHVAGTAALILSKRPGIGLDELKQTLRSAAQDVEAPGKDDYSGYGIINTELSLGKIAGLDKTEGPEPVQEKDDTGDNLKYEFYRSPTVGSFSTSKGNTYRTSLDI